MGASFLWICRRGKSGKGESWGRAPASGPSHRGPQQALSPLWEGRHLRLKAPEGQGIWDQIDPSSIEGRMEAWLPSEPHRKVRIVLGWGKGHCRASRSRRGPPTALGQLPNAAEVVFSPLSPAGKSHNSVCPELLLLPSLLNFSLPGRTCQFQKTKCRNVRPCSSASANRVAGRRQPPSRPLGGLPHGSAG